MENAKNANLIQALIKAEMEMEEPQLDKVNKAFGSSYSSLGELLRCVTPALRRNGLKMKIDLLEKDGFAGAKLTIYHVSGEMLESETTWVPTENEKNMRHSQGKSYTYAQRYLLAGFFQLHQGMNETDNDGNKEEVTEKRNISVPKRPQTSSHRKPSLGAWNELAQENLKTERIEMKRFFSIAKRKHLTEKQMKAIVYLYTQKISRADVTHDEFNQINRDLEDATRVDIVRMIHQAVELKNEVV